jgi:hypothetical protein
VPQRLSGEKIIKKLSASAVRIKTIAAKPQHSTQKESTIYISTCRDKIKGTFYKYDTKICKKKGQDRK